MKTTLITGANRGIGLEFTRQYASDGWRVLACTRRPDQSDALNTLAAQHPGQISVYRLDVADDSAIDQLASSLTGQPIDLLINNAGVYTDPKGGALNHDGYEAWMRAFLINTMATLKMVRAFRSHIVQSDQKTVVTISSKMGSIAENDSGGSYMYRSSKAAVNMVVKTLAIDLKAVGVIAVVLHPGWVKTEMGGPHALISSMQSVSGMREVINRLTINDSGKFIAYDGKEVPW
jgi:NAD(P)-dependent dehydrogenase (short-subunit alcohol dehydrogenase family)